MLWIASAACWTAGVRVASYTANSSASPDTAALNASATPGGQGESSERGGSAGHRTWDQAQRSDGGGDDGACACGDRDQSRHADGAEIGLGERVRDTGDEAAAEVDAAADRGPGEAGA